MRVIVRLTGAKSPDLDLCKTSFFSPAPAPGTFNEASDIYSAPMSSEPQQTPSTAFAPFHLGPWKVVPNLNELIKDGDSVRIQGQQMALLVQLARSPGELVTRDALLDQLWGQRPVTDDVLSRSIAALRAALGDNARAPQFIETIPKKGYRLLVPPRFTGMKRLKLPWVVSAIILCCLLAATFVLIESDPPPKLPDPAALAENFTARPGVETYPTLSPDGRYLAYVENQPELQTLLVADAASRRVRSTWPAPGLIRGLAFAPSGDRVALVSLHNGACTLVVLTLLTDQETALTACWGDEPTGVTWSRDSRYVVFTALNEAGSPGLASLNLATGDKTTLTNPPEHENDLFPAFTPDGRRLSFSRGDETTREIFQIAWRADEPMQDPAPEPERLTTDNQLAARHAWLSGTQFIFSSDRAARQALWMRNIEDSTTTFFGARGARQPSLSNAGDLAYQVAIFEANLWLISLNSPDSPPTVLVQSRRYDNHPAYSPDGRRLLFLSNRSGKSALWVSNADGTEQTRVYESENGRLTRPAWSDDGEWMLGVIFRENSSKVLRVARDGGEPEFVSRLGDNVVQAIPMGNGSWASIVEESNGPVLEWHPAAGKPLRFDNISPNHVARGPKGSLYFTAQGLPGIRRLDLQSGATTVIVEELVPENWNAWTTSSTAVYYAHESGLWRQPFLDGEPELVSELVPSAIGLTMAVHPDESELVITRTDHVEIDIMLARGLLDGLKTED